jgi:hypothetical protein
MTIMQRVIMSKDEALQVQVMVQCSAKSSEHNLQANGIIIIIIIIIISIINRYWHNIQINKHTANKKYKTARSRP